MVLPLTARYHQTKKPQFFVQSKRTTDGVFAKRVNPSIRIPIKLINVFELDGDLWRHTK